MTHHGGRFTLRLSSSGPTRVEYDGEFAADGFVWKCRATISVADGTVEFGPDAGGAPEWLTKIARATLRTAWRSTSTGTAWPRRLHRWRDEP